MYVVNRAQEICCVHDQCMTLRTSYSHYACVCRREDRMYSYIPWPDPDDEVYSVMCLKD